MICLRLLQLDFKMKNNRRVTTVKVKLKKYKLSKKFIIKRGFVL